MFPHQTWQAPIHLQANAITATVSASVFDYETTWVGVAVISFAERIEKHARINWKNLAVPPVSSPPFLILFINSICNMKCEHCFYWKELNQKTDLTFEELVALSNELGRIETLNLSGGEPFIRKEFAEICKQFIRKNGVREIYVPTNGYFTDRTIKALKGVLEESSLKEIGVEISLDGMPEFHDEFRKTRYSFHRAMETYDAMAELQKSDSRLQIYAISTATEDNMDEIRQLTTFLYDRCPQMAHHHLALIRGDRKNPSLQGPSLQEYRDLHEYACRLWAPRHKARSGSVVEPMLQHVKTQTAEQERQVVPCRAGVLSAVIYANGDVGICEQRPPIGNLRKSGFMDLWHAHATGQVRKSIRARECYCTNEIFLWPSIVFQPFHLAKSMIGAKVWKKQRPLAEQEKSDYRESLEKLDIPRSALDVQILD
jgi:MoaA/NifB/PqqE/SkfB family radical SAM enzyme